MQKLEGVLGERWAGTCSGIRQHVPSRTVAAATTQARAARADALVAFGGGSPIDAAKIVALELLGDGEPQAAMPQIAVSTTLSAGEFTPFAGITDEETRVKGLRTDPRICPRTVVLDPEVTLSTPHQLWAATGVKAMDHAASVSEPDNLEARGECTLPRKKCY